MGLDLKSRQPLQDATVLAFIHIIQRKGKHQLQQGGFVVYVHSGQFEFMKFMGILQLEPLERAGFYAFGWVFNFSEDISITGV